ncbi:allophanate hydrolase [Streptomyces paludis]|uniref:Allophanate hydrolase n=1 Tax=Streptomyces paludis TaxID=2282738 RepID=A0A345HYT4_9ACTN|nr:allophanate hydrolase [Streptomyces paludis]AXG81858.1 allophanate hydrolase [Streptomyces paludis]
MTTARRAVETCYERIRAAARPEIWITLREPERALALADEIDARVRAGATLPLAGTTVAVKDNIDVAGLPTTAGAPGVRHTPATGAETVRLLEEAGAVVVGKTNLDQFATGLVGTRTPYGTPASASDPALVAGGSSSGSALAVALGLVDMALGTDTAGSGRVPAAFNHLVGVKPTLGMLSSAGVYPASPSYDTVSVFARTLTTAGAAMEAMTAGAASRPWERHARLSASRGQVGIVGEATLALVDEHGRAAYRSTVEALTAAGIGTTEIDPTPLLDAAKLLYDGALLAERAYAFGAVLAELGPEADPTVASIVLPARRFAAVDLVRDQQRLVAAQAIAAEILTPLDALLLPTTPGHPSIDEVRADPVGANARNGTFTNFVNLLDLSALAVPAAGSTPSRPVGVTLVGRAHHDLALADVAARAGLTDALPPAQLWGAPYRELMVMGAHRTGQPLNHQLADTGARLLGTVRTAPAYRMARLATTPPKPAVWRTETGGASITGELWALTPDGFTDFLGQLAAPMAITPVTLEDGREVLGFTCAPGALDGAEDITTHADWPTYLATTTPRASR